MTTRYVRHEYVIEVREGDRWIHAPGEAAGWHYDEARRAIRAGILGLDGSPYSRLDVRLRREDGEIRGAA